MKDSEMVIHCQEAWNTRYVKNCLVCGESLIDEK
tara:strand:- start:377 stop:478 length:102 start_codon:yes stop_codon:yes gene_type:complete